MAQVLLAYFSGDFSQRDADDLRALVSRLAEHGPWSRAAPEFVDQLEEDSRTRPEDEPVRTVGLALEIGSAHEQVHAPVAEPARIVDALAEFSRTHGVDFELQLDTTYVGEIRQGEPDRLVREGLLSGW